MGPKGPRESRIECRSEAGRAVARLACVVGRMSWVGARLNVVAGSSHGRGPALTDIDPGPSVKQEPGSRKPPPSACGGRAGGGRCMAEAQPIPEPPDAGASVSAEHRCGFLPTAPTPAEPPRGSRGCGGCKGRAAWGRSTAGAAAMHLGRRVNGGRLQELGQDCDELGRRHLDLLCRERASPQLSPSIPGPSSPKGEEGSIQCSWVLLH